MIARGWAGIRRCRHVWQRISLGGLHVFEGFAFSFADKFHDEPDRDRGEGGVKAVGAAEAEGAEKNREGHGDGEVRDPLDEPAHGKSGAAELVWKHFAEHDPHDWPPGNPEEKNVSVRCDERGEAAGTGHRELALRVERR